MTPDQVLTTQLTANQGVMAVMNEQGDKKTIWDRTQPDEVEAARREFDFLKGKGYMAYRVEGREGRRGTVIREFDPTAERIIFAPPMKGGAQL